MNLGASLALAARSLRLDSRSPFVHLLRCSLAAVLLCALIGVFLSRATFGAPGLILYEAVITIDFIFASVLGVALFATAIAEERREGSLDLMKMAGLSPLGILVGKSMSQLTIAISLLAVQLPFTMFAPTLGGISHQRILTGFIALGSYLMFAYGVGILCSTVCRTGIVASRLTAGVLVVATIWPYLVALVLAIGSVFGLSAGGDPSPALLNLTVWDVIRQTASEKASQGPVPLFGAACAAHLIGAAVTFLAAWLLFDVVETRAGRERSRRTLFGADAWGGVQRVPRFSGNALVWKDYRLFVGGRRGMLVRFLIYGAGMLVLAWFSNPLGKDFERHAFGQNLLIMLGVGVVLDLGSLAGRVFRDEIAWQTYSTLLLLPKSVLQISYGKVMGCMLAVLPALCYMVIGVLCAEATLLIAIGPLLFVFVTLLYMLLPLIVYASLWLQRGAFPLTVFGFLVTLVGLYVLVTRGFGGAFWCLFGLVVLIVSWRWGGKMHTRILDRLRELSGSDL